MQVESAIEMKGQELGVEDVELEVWQKHGRAEVCQKTCRVELEHKGYVTVRLPQVMPSNQSGVQGLRCPSLCFRVCVRESEGDRARARAREGEWDSDEEK